MIPVEVDGHRHVAGLDPWWQVPVPASLTSSPAGFCGANRS